MTGPHFSRFGIYALLAILASVSCSAFSQEDNGAFEDIQHLREQVGDALTLEFGNINTDAEVQISVSQLDNRLRLAKCSQPKDIKLNGTQRRTRNVSVRVSCNGNSPWSIFVPAQIEVFQNVVVTTRDILKGEQLVPADIVLAKRDTSNLGFGYVGELKQLVGKELTRNVPSGHALRLAHVSEPNAISRGDKITIEAGTGGLIVASTGIAMADGKIGEQITVKNAQSKRVIEAYVVAPGRVAANL